MKTPYHFLLFLLITACSSNQNEPIATTIEADSSQQQDSTLIAPKEFPKFTEGDFEDVDVTAFNTQLSQEKKSLNPEEVVTKYYPAVVAKDDPSFQNIKLETKKEGEKTIVTLTHDNQPHIVIQGHRIVMTMTKEKGQWKVLAIQQQFKCWKRRGIVWGVDRCS